MMRKKLLLILAVPILFMLSIFFLMSDIKNIPETRSMVPPASSQAEEARNEHHRRVNPARPNKNRLDPVLDRDNNNNNKLDEADKVNIKFDTNDYDSTKTNEKSKDSEETEKTKLVPEQKDSSSEEEVLSEKTKRRQEAVKQAYLHSWRQYEKYAWGRDELQPPFKTGKDWLGMGLSIVDSIDTMWLMGLTDEYAKARDWIEKNLHFDNINREISFFETTIRVVGGLISIYDLTGDRMYLEKAEDLGTRLMPVFDTPAGYAKTTINLRTGQASNPSWAMSSAILSECGTVQMEYSTLSKHTGNSVFREKAMKAYDKLNEISKPDGLYPVYLNVNSGGFANSRVTLGALGDSFYEYLLKVWILTGKKEEKYRKMYDDAMKAVIAQLVKKSSPSGLTYIAEKEGGIVDKMDHLVCFAGAMFALGAYHNATEDVELHWELGKEITKTCHEFYIRQRTGLGPEIARFSPGNDFIAPGGANHYILRPETVESYFVLYWLTKDEKYQDWGWEAFQAIETHCKTSHGYVGVRDVTQVPVQQDDLQQSFFMAETLKYLYLLFSPRSTVDLDKWVFNTEAHPIHVW